MTGESFTPMLPPDLRAAIGALITTWGNACGILSMLISNLAAKKLLGKDDDTVFAFAHIGMDARVQIGLIRTMGPARVGSEHAKTIGKFCDRLEGAKKLRDKYAHSPWGIDEQGKATAFIVKTVGKLHYREEKITAKNVDRETQELAGVMKEMVEFFTSHGYMTPPEEWNGQYV